jgi:hypothetical protein
LYEKFDIAEEQESVEEPSSNVTQDVEALRRMEVKLFIYGFLKIYTK